MTIVSSTLPAKDADAIRCLCSAGEVARWFGQPEALRYARRYGACTWFGFSLVLVSVVMLAMAFTFITPRHEFRLLSIAGIVVGVFLVCIPVWARRKAIHTVYVLTNKRALIVKLQNVTARLSDSCGLGTARDILCSAPDKAGYGDIALNYAEVESEDGYLPGGVIFRDIPSVIEVKSLLDDLAAEARRTNLNRG